MVISKGGLLMSAEVEIYHLYHSGVAVKTADKVLIFDYYNDRSAGDERRLEQGVINEELLREEKDIFVFVTHNHHDHFNRVIFDWEEENDNINYILSADVKLSTAQQKKDNYYVLDKYENLNIDDLVIETYGTTDQGLSYYVEVDGFNIFHSGDLNWWHWKKFSAAERKVEEEDFKEELARFKDKNLDIAFVPVDPRLEEHYYLAGQYFAQTIAPKLLVPIHFSDNYYITEEFAEVINNLAVESAVINGRGEKIVYDK